jgi:hypothetical protein
VAPTTRSTFFRIKQYIIDSTTGSFALLRGEYGWSSVAPTTRSTFFRITQYIIDSTTGSFALLRGSMDGVPWLQPQDLLFSNYTIHHRQHDGQSPQTPRCRRERRLPLKAQTPLNHEKFAPTGSRTQDLRCFRGSCNH